MKQANKPIVQRPCVLLVDDDSGARRAIRLLLRARGYDVRDYAQGAELLADEGAVEGHCLITDYCMPVMDGFALLNALRERGRFAPAILISGRYERQLEQRALKAGFAALVEKPLTDERMLDVLAGCLRATRSGLPAGAAPAVPDDGEAPGPSR